MSSAQQQRAAVPSDQQSVLPAVRGVPWWGAVLVAAVVTAIGAAIDANNTDALGAVFKFCYLVGCVTAALAVRRRALFTAAAQPPLIAFLVGIITLYTLNADQASGLKSLIFKVLIPIANAFPWMALTFVVTLGLVLARFFLTGGRIFGKGITKPSGTPTTHRGTGKAQPRKAAATRKAGTARPQKQTGQKTRPKKSGTQKPGAPKAGARKQGGQKPGTQKVRTQKTDAHRTEARKAQPRKPQPQQAGAQKQRPQKPRPQRAEAPRAAAQRAGEQRAAGPRQAVPDGARQQRPTEQVKPRPRPQSGAAADNNAAPKPRATAGAVLREASERAEAATTYPTTRARYRT